MLSETASQCSDCVATLAKLLVELSIIRKKYLAEYFIYYYKNIPKSLRFFTSFRMTLYLLFIDIPITLFLSKQTILNNLFVYHRMF